MSNSVATENQALASEVLSELSAVPVAFPVGTTPPVPTTATTSRRRPRVVRNAPVVVATTEEINYDAPTEEAPTEVPTPAPTPSNGETMTIRIEDYNKMMKELTDLRNFKATADEKDKKKAEQRKARRDARKAGGGEGGEGGGGRKSRAKKTGLSEEDVRRIAQEEARKINGASVAGAEDSEDEEEDADE